MSGLDFLLIVPSPFLVEEHGGVHSATAQVGLTVDGPGFDAYRAQHGASADAEAGRMLRRARDIARLDTIVDAFNPTDHDPGDEDRER